MDTASSQPGEIALPLPAAGSSDGGLAAVGWGLPPGAAEELSRAAEAESCGLTREEFAASLHAVGLKLNYGLPPGTQPDAAEKTAFFPALRLPELALAQACALGREAAWSKFLELYRAPLTQAAIAITGSATLGHDLADSLYSELYGLKERDGNRRSPLASYSGRGSLMGWLRTTLAQRHVDHHRRTRREEPLDDLDLPAAQTTTIPAPAELARLSEVIGRTLRGLEAEDRFLLSSYFLDGRTLLEISRTLHVHEATVSRRLKRLASDVRKLLLHNLQAGGLSKRAAEEALGVDPRDLEINLRAWLQTSQLPAFSDRAAENDPAVSDRPGQR